MEISIHKILWSALAVMALFSCEKEQSEEWYEPHTAVGKMLAENEVGRIYKDTSFVISPGVEETDLMIQMSDGYRQTLYIVCADLSYPGVSMRTMVPAMNGTKWTTKTPRALAKQFDQPRERIVAMTNGDYWDTRNPIKPRGPVRMGWEVFLDKFNYDANDPQQALGFVGINTAGRLIIAESSRYPSLKNTIKDCTGCGVIVLSGGQIRKVEWTARQARTCIGVAEDGKVYMVVADGRRRDQSRDRWDAQGLSYSHMSYLFKGLGCRDAACLDGGGSSQLISRDPVERKWLLRNRPAFTGGEERPVINAWAVTVDEP